MTNIAVCENNVTRLVSWLVGFWCTHSHDLAPLRVPNYQGQNSTKVSMVGDFATVYYRIYSSISRTCVSRTPTLELKIGTKLF